MLRAWAEYIAERKASVAVTPESTTVHKTNIPDSRKLTRELQEFVRKRRLQRQKTVAKDLAVFLRSNGFLGYSPECSVSVASVLRCVRRFLSGKGYRRGKKKSS